MKSYLQVLFLFLLINPLAFPQWTNQNFVPGSNDLWSTFFIDDYIGWIVGSGILLKTTNAGVDWIEQSGGGKAIQFVDHNTGWICGGSQILKTTDGGTTWITLASGTTDNLTDIHFYDADTGYVVGFGGTILKTTNGGIVWTSLSSGTTVDLNSVDFFDALLGYAVGGDEYSEFIVIKTTDGGNSWVDKSSGLPSISGYLVTIEFIDTNTGFIGGGVQHDNFIYKTTDGGDTWFLQTLQFTKMKEKNHIEHINFYDFGGINSIYFKDSNVGYATSGQSSGCYSQRYIYATTDGGSTWNVRYLDYEYLHGGLTSIYVNNLGTGWVVGSAGVVFITQDGGNAWSQILSGSEDDNISSLFFVNESIGWAVGGRDDCFGGGHIIINTTDGGKIWKTQLHGLAVDGSIRSVFFINENIGWTVGDGLAGLFRTTDGGENWIHEYNIEGSFIFFINQDTGWVTSDDYNVGIYKSIDGGDNWIQKSSISSSNVYFIDANTGWATTEEGILKSTNGGETWINKTSLTGSYINFYDSNVGMCVGGGSVLVSTDGGETWTTKSGPSFQTINFTNSTSIWGYTSFGSVYRTNDFGDNWESLVGGYEGHKAFFVDEYTGWVCDANNIYKYSVEPPVPPVWSNQIIVEDSSGTEDLRVLTFGQHSEATDSIDTELGEYEIPPPPPALIFDARFNLPTNPLTSSLTDYRDSVETDITWTMQFQPDNMAYPMTFSWDSTAFPEGTFYLKDQLNGSFVFVNMREQSSYALTETAITSLDISYRGNCSMVSVNSEWNMVSVPLLTEDMSLDNLFPTATSLAYGYNGSYTEEDTLLDGVGYWLKFAGNEQIQLCGALLGDSVQVVEGWNMFGVFDEDILVNQLTTTPPGIIATFLFGFNDGYYIADTLKSGQGFWVRVTEDGVIDLSGGTVSKDREKKLFAQLEKEWGKIKITDSKSKSATLYASEKDIDYNGFELPPRPPSGIFDARYNSQRIVESLKSEKIIQISSDNYPITIRAEGLNITVRDKINGKLINEELKSGEEVTIINNKIVSIAVKGTITTGLPVRYELSQNYPNPFNPSTIINFALPKDSEVNLTLFNILGEKVTQLLNQGMKAGYHQIEFDASQIASGVYLYRIEAADFIETKKMVLMK